MQFHLALPPGEALFGVPKVPTGSQRLGSPDLEERLPDSSSLHPQCAPEKEGRKTCLSLQMPMPGTLIVNNHKWQRQRGQGRGGGWPQHQPKCPGPCSKEVWPQECIPAPLDPAGLCGGGRPPGELEGLWGRDSALSLRLCHALPLPLPLPAHPQQTKPGCQGRGLCWAPEGDARAKPFQPALPLPPPPALPQALAWHPTCLPLSEALHHRSRRPLLTRRAGGRDGGGAGGDPQGRLCPGKAKRPCCSPQAQDEALLARG